jgi:chromosome segregation ATPase
MSKEDFEMLLKNDWEPETIKCLNETYLNLRTYKYILTKYTIDNISHLLNLANNIKNELENTKQQLKNKENEVQSLKEEIFLKEQLTNTNNELLKTQQQLKEKENENYLLKRRMSNMKFLDLIEKNLV